MFLQNLRLRRLVASGLVLLGTWSSVSCNKGKGNNATSGPAGGAPLATAPAASSQLTPDYLDELLAPVALYPDVVLIQIFTAATNPQEVLDAGNWLIQNVNLSTDQRVEAAKQVGFGPSTLALVQFPQVVDMMCQQMDWTKQVGEAFKTDQKAVLASAQRLRTEAVNAGSLRSTPEQTVTKENQGGQQVVVVQPANPQVVYVPQYDPEQVYSPPPESAASAPQQTTTTTTQTTEAQSSGVSTGTAVAASLLSFGVGMALGSALHHDDYYYPNWGYGAAFYGPRPYVPAAYAYRPVYGSAFRPAYGYAAPARYPYAYNNAYRGGNNNITVNQNNYYNRFHNNQNINNRNANISRAGYNGNVANSRPGTRGSEQWKGKSTYAGGNRQSARNEGLGGNRSEPGGNRSQLGTNRSQSLDRSVQPSGLAANRASGTGNALAGRTANGPTAGTRNANTQPAVSRTSNSQPRSLTQPSQRASSDRGYGGGQREASSQSNRSSAFSGGSAREEKAASSRGHQSSGGGGKRGGGGRRG